MADQNPTVPKDEDFDKMYDTDRFDPTSLNPSGTGNVDEGRNYYRSASMDDSREAPSYSHAEEATIGPAPEQRRIKTEGDFAKLSSGHFDEEFAHTAHGKHGANNKKKKSHKNKNDHSNQNPASSSYNDDSNSEQTREASSTSSFPWKSNNDVPIIASKMSDAHVSHGSSSVFNQESDNDLSNKGEKKKAKFTLGEEEDISENEEDYPQHRQYRRPSTQHIHHHKNHKTQRQGSLLTTQPSVMEEDDENLRDPDMEDVAVHRYEKAAGMARHKITREKTMMMEDSVQDFGRHERAAKTAGYGFQRELDHTPHNLFVEMDELENNEWIEKARWIKYEEDLEAECGRWGKPHVSSLSFRSLINVRKSLEKGVMLLDLQEKDLPGVVHRVVEALSVEGIIEEVQKPELLRILNYRHKYVQPHSSNFRFGLKRTASQKSLPDSNSNVMPMNGKEDKQVKIDMRRSSSSHILKRSESTEAALHARKQDILSCLEDGTEGCLTLVGTMSTEKPICAFIRLGEAIVMNNTIEVTLPMRFIYILLTPEMDFRMDPHEIGRSFSTLMANNSFHNVCYGIDGKRELLHAINIFLDDSVVLPPGDWNKQKLLAMADIMEMRKRRETRRQAALIAEESQNNLSAMVNGMNGGHMSGDRLQSVASNLGIADQNEKTEEAGGGEKPIRNPLTRTPHFFGGLIDDIKYRYPLYWSDIKDGFNPQVFAAIIFIYFAALSGAIAFGGLMAEKTNNDIGIPETLLMSAVTGAVFALTAGCPLIIIGTTGPVLLFDEALFGFCKNLEIDFLTWRTWVGIWTFVIALIIAFFQGSTLVRFFSKFTKDIFAALISLLFIFEAFSKLVKIYGNHPVISPEAYCNETEFDGFEQYNRTLANGKERPIKMPNVALLSTILMLGTFFIGYFLRIFRNSKVFGRNVRRALGDFGVPIAIVLMVLLNYIFKEAGASTLDVPAKLQVTKPEARGWFIPPVTSGDNAFPVWAMFAAILPALLLYVLLFMETSICQLIMLDKTKGVKGVGVHLDIVLLGGLNTLTALFGGPWICAATVRAVSHVSALLVVSTNVVPGESAKVIGVRDQRLSAFVVSILLGLSVLMGPLLSLVPTSVLFGVFLYMGISGMNGVQLFDRLKLFVVPIKHHPAVSYIKYVKTWRMFLYTFFQTIGLAILWAVKSSPAAIAFPFFVVAMVPLRKSLQLIFTERELQMLDGPEAGKEADNDDEEDFYEAAANIPIVPNSAVPLHRSILGIINMTGVTIPRKKES